MNLQGLRRIFQVLLPAIGHHTHTQPTVNMTQLARPPAYKTRLKHVNKHHVKYQRNTTNPWVDHFILPVTHRHNTPELGTIDLKHAITQSAHHSTNHYYYQHHNAEQAVNSDTSHSFMRDIRTFWTKRSTTNPNHDDTKDTQHTTHKKKKNNS